MVVAVVSSSPDAQPLNLRDIRKMNSIHLVNVNKYP